MHRPCMENSNQGLKQHTPPNCEERETSETFKMKIYVSAGNRTSDTSLSNQTLGHRDRCFVA